MEMNSECNSESGQNIKPDLCLGPKKKLDSKDDYLVGTDQHQHSRKKKVDVDVPTGSISHTDSSVLTTKAVFTIYKQFENVLELKDKISTCMKKVKRSVNPELVDEEIVCSEGKGKCTLLFPQTVTKRNAEKFIMDLDRIVNTDLNSTVSFNLYSFVDKNPDALNDTNQKLKMNMIDKKVIFEAAPNVKSDQMSNAKKDMSEPLPIINKASVMTSNTKDDHYNQATSSIPTSVKVKIMARDVDTNTILDLLSPIKDLQTSLEKVTVDSSNNTCSHCTLVTTSKSAALRITKQINATKWNVNIEAFVAKHKQNRLINGKALSIKKDMAKGECHKQHLPSTRRKKDIEKQKDLILQSGSKSSDPKTKCKKKRNKSCVQCLKAWLKIDKHFEQDKDLKRIIRRNHQHLNPSGTLNIVDDSIMQRDKRTSCTVVITTKGTNPETLLHNLCKEMEKTIGRKVELIISKSVENNSSERKEPDKENIRNVEKMKNCIQDTLGQIESKTQSILKTHYKKISEVEKKHTKLLERNDEDNSSELKATEDKIEELKRQSVVFQEWCSTMSNKLHEIDPSQIKKAELTALTQQVGVECQRLANALPMYARRKDIVDKVSSNQVSIILGETGSGKSTQLVQYLYEAGLTQTGQIVCTQPRKVAAITLAERVAKEMVKVVGHLVGYKTGVRKKMSDATKIIFSTDHSLLNECLKNQNFSGYSCIIVDEAHERSIYTDLLLGMIKKCLPERPDLKVIITSATIDPSIFIQYFHSEPELSVSGRMFPVDIIYDDSDTDVEFEDYERKAVAKALEVHRHEEPGDILVFLTSPVEIMRCCEEFEKQMKGARNFKCFPLHGQLPPEEQKKVFDQLKDGMRKIVFATNCAETSITIDGIKFVIDTGVVKEVKYDAKKNISILGTHVISKSSANQRKGRAGRTASGKCFRLYSEKGYNSMELASKPEILRVHLGQAVLKLAALGIDCTSYDFVESPGQNTIDAAMSSLFHLGAMSKDGITDLGKWINKLPFDPRQGFLIYHGMQENVLYDAVVIASLLTNGSNIFYRGMSETDQQKSSKSKTRFASQDGDVFTWLQVYKDWIKEPKTSQSKWCKNNSINYKVISYTRQEVEEIAEILNKEAKVKMGNTFSENVQVINLFKKLIFQAYTSSLSHFLGHLRAGYYALKIEKQIHFHPSSSLLSLNSQPEWIVYTDLTETTRAFIKGISIVDEGWVVEALQQGRLSFSMEDVKERKIEVVHKEELGMTMFRNLVGPRYSHLRELEEELLTSGMSTVVVEADGELGIIDVHSSSPMNANIVKELKKSKKITLQSLQLDEDEIAVIKNSNGSDASGFRVVLGQGGSVKTLLMPDESNKIIIKKSSFRTTEEEIRNKFSVYGNILECIKFKSSNPWGFIRYGSKYEAKFAVESTEDGDKNVAWLKTEIECKKAQSKFEVKVTWCRRAIIGNGKAYIKCPAIDQASLLGQHINLSHGPCEIKLPEGGNDLICFNTQKASEKEIEDSVLSLVNFDKRIARQLFVIVVRFKVPAWENEVNEMKNLLTNELKKFATILKVPHNNFQINVKTPKDSSINYTGFINFDKISEGEQLCKFIRNKLTIEGEPVDVNPTLKTTLFVSSAIMIKIKKHFDETVEYLKSESYVDINVREMKLGDVAVDIRSVSAKYLVEARDLFQKLLDGEVIDCSLSDFTRRILKQEGKKMLKGIEEKLDILIVVDERRERIQLYGSHVDINNSKFRINEYLEQLLKAKKIEIVLSGHGKPPGIMKELMKKFGDLPDGIVKNFDLTDIDIDFKRQKMSIFGPPEAVDKTEQCIKDIEQNLASRVSLHYEKWMPDCVVCMCPIENHCELYRLEGCCHSYCHSCINMMVRVAVDDKKFPIDCAQENCQIPLVWKDLRFCLKQKWILETKLVLYSLDSLVAKNSSHYKYCKTANCPVVYEVTETEEGNEFNCPACLNSICTSCHANYHVGLSCKMFISQQESDKMFERWKQADPKNRKSCPSCKAPVEKNEGCNHMECTACKIHFCWICLASFQDEQDCYKHLRKLHGGII